MNKKTAWLLITAILFTAITTVVTVRRTLKGSNDFDTYYSAGKAVLEHRGIYYTGEFYEENTGSSPFLYAPVVACFFSLFALLPKIPASIVWHLLNLSVSVLVLYLSFRITNNSKNRFPSLLTQHKTQAFLSFLITVLLLLDNLSMAQVNILIFSLILLSIYCLRSEKFAASGLTFSASILFKLTPLLFGFFFLARRSWKTLLWAFGAMLLLTLVIPSMIMGLEGSRIAHRQWIGRAVKPISARFIGAEKERDTAHPSKKTYEDLEYLRLESLLIKSNQSLSGAMTRLFLKDRNGYADSTAYPMYSARKYRKLPVIFGIPKARLELLILCLQMFLFLILMVLSLAVFKGSGLMARNGLISVYFLSLSLFSPMARSHQFVFWIFPIMTLWSWKAEKKEGNTALFTAGCIFYLLQALPYGKAAGMGAAANLAFWIYFTVRTAAVSQSDKQAVL